MNTLLIERRLIPGSPARRAHPPASDTAMMRRLTARLRKPLDSEVLREKVEEALLIPIRLPERQDTTTSFLAQIALVQPYRHGGINE